MLDNETRTTTKFLEEKEMADTVTTPAAVSEVIKQIFGEFAEKGQQTKIKMPFTTKDQIKKFLREKASLERDLYRNEVKGYTTELNPKEIVTRRYAALNHALKHNASPHMLFEIFIRTEYEDSIDKIKTALNPIIDELDEEQALDALASIANYKKFYINKIFELLAKTITFEDLEKAVRI